ncbi:hypothetical protein CSOJ01_15889 [Colletotrichum sojae]|uniref:Uncharacterized protein n=1 Tax=Colletotrichum sojae TaxID=2175907 RepID=A0A8H6MGT0_9PEZI|nr:hypothetical protein CSOJ01_15889 [Colletotrichum sojae]
MLFERDFTGSSTFARESDIPEGVLNRVLRASGDKTVFLNVLSRSQGHLSDATIAALVELLKDEDSYVRSSATYALGKQSTLSDITIATLIELFKDEDSSIRSSAADTLGKQSTLSDATIAALVELFKDKDSSVRSCAANALGKQSTLSDATVTTLVELFKHKDSNSALSDKILDALAIRVQPEGHVLSVPVRDYLLEDGPTEPGPPVSGTVLCLT